MSAARPADGGSHNSAKPATAARIYDYFLGGTHNFPADREAANTIIGMLPRTQMAAQLNRAFLRRAVRRLCDLGVTQFLDIGSGIPTEGNVHEIAQEANPQARVVYVDIDPVAVAESMEMLEGNNLAVAIQGDARDPRAILSHPQVRKMLDFDQPVAVLLVAVLHFINDDAEARDVVRTLLDGVTEGSYLVVSHGVDETRPDVETHEELKSMRDVYKRQTAAMLRLRTRAEIAEFFEGLELFDPGVVWAWDWNPSPDDPYPVAEHPDPYTQFSAVAGVAGGVGKLAKRSG